MTDIRFDGRVAIVTGAGGGLGRAHALALAARGAKVVVNDLGGALDGSGGSSQAALAVVAEIEAAGGEAMANGASVTDDLGIANMVAETLERWGRIDILIANAGILRDRSFAKMTLEDFQTVLDVHVLGAFKTAHAVWPVMQTQSYGRIVLTTSSSGLYGNFGQANYGAAKTALVGLMQVLKIEGQKTDIRVNAVSPVAATRMTEALMPAEMLQVLRPGLVTPGVVYLASDEAPTGAILAAGAGGFALIRIFETEGVHLGDATPEAVRDAWTAIADPAGQHAYVGGPEQTTKFVTNALKGNS